MAPHSSTLAWKIPWMEEPGRLQPMGSLRVGHDRATSLYFSLSCIGEGNGSPLQYSCLENPIDKGVWWATVRRVEKSRTWLRRLSMHTGPRYKFPGFNKSCLWWSGCCSKARERTMRWTVLDTHLMCTMACRNLKAHQCYYFPFVKKFYLFFGHVKHHAGFYFPDWGLNLPPGSESPEP